MLAPLTLAEADEGHLSRRAWPIAFTVASVVSGMAYCLLWHRVTGHGSSWVVPGDIWGAYRSTHFVAWGDLGGVYSAQTGLVTFPGALLLLAPVAMLTGALGMTESFPFTLPHPTSWYVLGPYEILLSCLALFATDALAERLGVSRGQRIALCAFEAVALWNVSAYWGHPEDAVAVALAVYAVVFAIDGRWTGAGWLFGAAVATQPLVLLMLPVLMGVAGRRRIAGLGVRALVPAAVLLVTPLLSEFKATTHALIDQPNYPYLDRVTPWTALAPRLGGHGQGLMVAAGPGRVVAVALACALGLWARRWRHRPELLVWGCALALALRCFTESVMVPYYVWPVVAVALVACAARSSTHLALGGAVAVFLTVFGDWRLSEWAWWLPVTAAIVAVLGAGLPMNRVRLGLPVAPGRQVAARSGRGVLAGAAQ
jgi:hypothetical protein